MSYPVNYKNITADIDFYQELDVMHREAENYLRGFKWCKEIKNSFLYTNLGGVLCIFLFEIINTQSSEDNFLWVMVGDFPPMYLDVYGPKKTKHVVEDYINLAQDWIDQVKKGIPVIDCYPFNAEPTLELAERLEKRVLFMKNELLDNMDDISFRN
ncbi:hypothetical protein AB6735_25015 [Mucilaginibacter sp. RCC_168]|uniref:hypothetical protein n=1 Tax=Mucilaginibacter sp. RCC_168 TaxID=3239221 RepID=UPI00352677EB